MPRSANAFKIGIFSLICGAILFFAIIWLVAAPYLERTQTYVSYFNESVKGLQKDAVVNYRGVSVGRVASIEIAPDGRLVEVRLKLKHDFHVDESVAIQLREQGLTGLRYLEIDKAPKNIDELTPKITFPTKYPVLRSYPSEIEQLKTALEDLYRKVASLDLRALTDSWTRTSELMNNLLMQIGAGSQTGNLGETVLALRNMAQEAAALLGRISSAATQQGVNKAFEDLSATLAASREASEQLASLLKDLPPDALNQLSRQMQTTVKSGGTVIANLNRQLENSSVLLQQDLEQLKTFLFQLNSLIQELKEQPNRIIFPSKTEEPFKKKEKR